MTAPKASATAARIQRLEAQLTQMQAQLRHARQQQQRQAQAQRHQRLLAYGHLVVQAGLDHVAPAVLLGLLRDGAARLADPATQQRWETQGAAELTRTPRLQQRLQPLLAPAASPDAPPGVSHPAPSEPGGSSP